MCKREKGLIHNGSEIKLAHFLASFAYECDIKFDIWPVARGSFLIFKHAHWDVSYAKTSPWKTFQWPAWPSVHALMIPRFFCSQFHIWNHDDDGDENEFSPSFLLGLRATPKSGIFPSGSCIN